MNANKKGVTLNLKSERGRADVRGDGEGGRCRARGLTLGSMERLGFGYEDLARINPRVISATIKGFGRTGPYARYKCFR